MKLILLYLAVVLCFVGKARSFRNGAGFYTSLGGQMRVFDFNKKTLDAKSSGGSKDYNLSDGGKSNSRKNLSPATGGSATQQSNLDDSHAPNLGKSETMLSLLGYLGAFRPVLSGLTSLPRVGGGAHGNIGLRAEISRNGVNLSGDSSARGSLNVNPLSGLSTKSGNDATVQGQQAAASGGSKHNVENSSLSTGSATSNKGADKPSEHLSNLFLKGLKGIVEPITSAAGGSVSSAVENLKAQIKKFIEPLTEDHGPTSTSASVSGDSSTSSRLDDHPSDGLSKVSGDDPTVQGHDVAASDGSKQNVEDSTLSTGSATSNEGGMSSESSRSNVHLSDGFSMESGDDATVQGQQAAASGGPKQNVESSNSSTGSATSNGGGDSNEVSGPSSSAVDSTDSGDRGNLADKQGPGFNGPEGVGENNGGSFRAGSLDTGSKSDSGSHNLSSGSGSRSNVSTGGEPSDKNEPADPGVSGRVTCPTGKTQSGSPSVA